MQAYVEREHEFRFLAVASETLEGTPSPTLAVGEQLLLTNHSASPSMEAAFKSLCGARFCAEPGMMRRTRARAAHQVNLSADMADLAWTGSGGKQLCVNSQE